ncbi:hypothetical protein F6R98_00725 [Candidatus Methylospira mobilis]|uniref:Uncharacterized protein n=1 Tax=Candidatus Methylospira mobilis TaxID=1808979 RepID=A0A5Q0BDW5_9GAMM|nr:hypothetical protein [Candidatus Methylospira mobilis]QFY41322.1 hypothetical protein F6R98_00725 [Candidatus Methylospira mobilis]WNV05452.1 hypothetical protein RP726_03320 [Candidatus Methylospira mobilis]
MELYEWIIIILCICQGRGSFNSSAGSACAAVEQMSAAAMLNADNAKVTDDVVANTAREAE